MLVERELDTSYGIFTGEATHKAVLLFDASVAGTSESMRATRGSTTRSRWLRGRRQGPWTKPSELKWTSCVPASRSRPG